MNYRRYFCLFFFPANNIPRFLFIFLFEIRVPRLRITYLCSHPHCSFVFSLCTFHSGACVQHQPRFLYVLSIILLHNVFQTFSFFSCTSPAIFETRGYTQLASILHELFDDLYSNYFDRRLFLNGSERTVHSE